MSSPRHGPAWAARSASSCRATPSPAPRPTARKRRGPGFTNTSHSILTPLAENPPEAVATVRDLWKACGAQVSLMEPERHDHVFAAVSHLPHMVAFALMEELAGRPDAETYFRHAGSGFRDFTRIAGSHPEMWRDISLANKDALVAELDAFIDKLSGIRDLLESGDSQALEGLFTRAREARLNWIKGRHD
jgi:prephenate dehydrogenase